MVVGNLNASDFCDTVVIGGGPGGYVCAIRLAQLGQDVLLVEERASLGGVCLNEGCIPSKALIHAAETLEQMQHASTMGLNLPGAPTVDMPTLQAWKDKIVKRLTGGVAQLEKAHGVRIMQGRATFSSPNTIDVVDADGRGMQVDFKHAVIATGTTPIDLPPVPHDGEFVIGSKEALDLQELPGHLIVIGGGYIGLEMGTAYAKLGSKVTVVEVQKELLGGSLEPEIHQLLLRRAKKIGLDVLTEHRAEKVEGKTLYITSPKGETLKLDADKILVAIGRRPNTQQLGLEHAGMSPDPQGFIPVDIERRTQVPHIFAIGDITGNPMLAHKAYREAKVAAEVIAGHSAAYDVRVVPAVMFVDPEIASVGLTEAAARDAGYTIETGVFPLKASGRAMTLGADGIAKVVVDAESKRLLGFHLAGPHAGELIGEGTLALELDAFLDDLAHTIHPHPTLSEAVQEAAELVLGSCAHFMAPKKRSA